MCVCVWVCAALFPPKSLRYSRAWERMETYVPNYHKVTHTGVTWRRLSSAIDCVQQQKKKERKKSARIFLHHVSFDGNAGRIKCGKMVERSEQRWCRGDDDDALTRRIFGRSSIGVWLDVISSSSSSPRRCRSQVLISLVPVVVNLTLILNPIMFVRYVWVSSMESKPCTT